MATPKNRRLAPGFWVDEAGDLHVSLPELLAELGLPDTEAARAELNGIIRQELARVIPRTEIVERDACPHCGLTGLGPHGPSCPYAGAVPGAEP